MTDHVEIDGTKYPIHGYAADGLPIIKGHATSIHHTDDAGNLLYDEEGNPVRSVHISASPTEPIKESEGVQ